MRPAPCYYIEPSEDDEEDVRLAVAWLRKATLRSSHQPLTGLVFTGVRRVLTNPIPLSAMGAEIAHSLASGNDVQFGGGAITNLTEQHHPSVWRGPVLALYPSMKTMGMVDDMFGVTEVLALPGNADISGWVNRRVATELTGKNKPAAPKLDPVFRAAMDTLGPSFGNKGLGMDDRDGVTEVFKYLHDARIPFTGDEARDYLMGKYGWVSIASDFAAKRADDIAAGKKIRWPKHPHYRHEIVNYWREKAASQ